MAPPDRRTRRPRRGHLAGATLALTLTCATAAAAALPANERRMRDWLPMSLAVTDTHVVYSRSSVTTVRLGGYTVWRTDTYRMPLRGARFTDGRLTGVVLRTSAGRTTAGPLAPGPGGTHLLVATGSGFSPQVTWCCENGFHDVPLEAQGRPDAPRTITAAIDGPVARLAMTDPDGAFLLATQPIPDGPRTRVRLGLRPARNAVALAPGLLAWIDPVDEALKVHHLPADRTGTDPDAVIAPRGVVRRLVASSRVIATVNAAPEGGMEVVRYDQPGWTPTVVWRGTRAPDLIAVGDRTLAIAVGTSVLQHVPGAPVRRVAVLRSRAFGLATDGTRIAVLERITTRVNRRTRLRQTALRVFGVVAPPPVYGTSEAAR